VSPLKPELPSLLQLQREARWVRDTIVFVESAFAPAIPKLVADLRELKRNRGRTEEELRRSAFAYVLGHLESMAVDAARAPCGKEHDFSPSGRSRRSARPLRPREARERLVVSRPPGLLRTALGLSTGTANELRVRRPRRL
jgi:hypothetical protein